MTQTNVILDLDMGIDDALALTYVLGNPCMRLVGVMASFGNVPCDLSAQNCLDMLDALGHPEVVVYAGAKHALREDNSYEGALSVHGANGLGDVELPHSSRTAVMASDIQGNAAVNFLLNAVRTYGTSLVYVPTGPLTNLALALDRDEAALCKLGGVIAMGGAISVPGNEGPTHAAEANIYADPEAAARVLSSRLPLTLIGLDVTHQVALSPAEVNAWRDMGVMGTTLANIVSFYLSAYEHSMPWLGGCALHDPLAAAVAADPSLVGTLATTLMVELEGPNRGRIMQDPRHLCDVRHTTEVALTVDRVRFIEECKKYIRRALAQAPCA